MRPITGGVPARSAAASAAADRPAPATVSARLGSVTPGMLPPPMVASVEVTEAVSPPVSASRDRRDSARASMRATGVSIMRTTGTDSPARPVACSRNVASSAA